eukprot:CAMPEP_0168762176 /NCGR_PEP_ID=MMETSP0724-20121128/23706_1 /TAXON_ID=265536 /ORGANISM="Amphiprora sp., Strain CCMP467" /LENGTH=663 /DNA_ID=CAMNT_0008811327 /DNA_START=27 /DNA_END=2016 /DNA_ORIENTATION=+
MANISFQQSVLILAVAATFSFSSKDTAMAFQKPLTPRKPQQQAKNRVVASPVEEALIVESSRRTSAKPRMAIQSQTLYDASLSSSSSKRASATLLEGEGKAGAARMVTSLPRRQWPRQVQINGLAFPPLQNWNLYPLEQTERELPCLQIHATTQAEEKLQSSEQEIKRKPSIPAFRTQTRKTSRSATPTSKSVVRDPVVSPIEYDTLTQTRQGRKGNNQGKTGTGSNAKMPTSDDSSYFDMSQSYTNDKNDSNNSNKLIKSEMQNKLSGQDIRRYYKTDLLTLEEEYTLGSQIQFMIACEDVHEGLSIRLQRLPTFGEWAAACGYSSPEPKFKPTEFQEQLRPAGSAEMFEELDPTLFVGSGQVGEAGPGRGRGRQKKVPSSRLRDRRKDSLVAPTNLRKKSAARENSGVEVQPRKRDGSPANRGTISDFLEMIADGHEAKQTMVQSNMRLVVSIARKYMNVGVSLHDLVQEGSLGLSRAAEKFDPRKGFKFSTYASWWIQQAVFRCIAYQSRTIRLPVHIHNMLNRIHRTRNALTREYGRAPTNEEMASQLGMKVQKYNKLLRLTKRSISLDLPKYKSNPKDLGHEGDDRLGDTISASSVGSVLLDDSAPEKMVDHSLLLDDLKNMLQILDKEERLVLCARYGLSDGISRTVTAVASQMKQS